MDITILNCDILGFALISALFKTHNGLIKIQNVFYVLLIINAV